MLIAIVIVLLAISAFFSWRGYKQDKANNTFYYWLAGAVVLGFLTKKMLALPGYTHIYLIVSIILGHMAGVFARTWDEW